MVPHSTGTPVARPAPTTENTRIWIVEVGAERALYALVRANDETTMMRTRPSETVGKARIPCPTVASTPRLATIAPAAARGAMRSNARPGRMAPDAYGIPMHAP